MGAVALILIGMFAFIIFRVTEPQMSILYSDLSLDDSGQIVTELESAGTSYELRNNGATILIPQDMVARTRMQLAQSGLPTGGSIGYEIFDRSDSLGATSFVQNINHLRAMEGELARTIGTLDRIVSARVHLVMPERELFQRDRVPPTASIVLKVRGTLSDGEIRAIQHLTATAVEGLTPEHVSIVDDSGRLLASGTGDATDMVSSSLQQRSVAIEQRLRNQIEEILNSVVGVGRSRVRVNADLNFDRTTQTSETYDPDGQVVRSTQTKEANSTSVSDNGQVTAGNQLPNAQAVNTSPGDRQGSNSTEEIVNYEISKATRSQVTEAGEVKRLSVAVLVDGTYADDGNGNVTYTPRTQEELDRIAVLVRSAVGFDESRGDVVQIVNLRFAQPPVGDLADTAPGMFDFSREDIMRFAELGVLGLISLMLILFVVRPLIRRIVTPEESSPQELMIAPDGTLMAESDVPKSDEEKKEEAVIEWIEEAKAHGELQAASIAKVGTMIEDYPNEAVNIVRGWLEDAA